MRLSRLSRLFLALVLVCSTLPAFALERMFPPIAKRGTLSMENYPTVAMNGEARRLSAGAWIRNENNTIDMPVTLRGRQFVVNFTENNLGEIDRVWILNPTEASMPAPVDRNAAQLPLQPWR
ncbi:MAG: hypothetical protein JWR21_730 [Herminiimonas sp.]|nr:hypothetical protein [Herminiimonas sp.]